MRFPPECVAFEVIGEGPYLRVGAIVEGCGATTEWYTAERGIGVAVTSVGDISRDATAEIRKNIFTLIIKRGWWGVCMHPDGLRPLTFAAAHMLRLFREGADLAMGQPPDRQLERAA